MILSGEAKENSALLIDKTSSDSDLVITVIPDDTGIGVESAGLSEDENVMQ